MTLRVTCLDQNLWAATYIRNAECPEKSHKICMWELVPADYAGSIRNVT